MTNDDYRACLKALGLTPMKPSYEGSTLHQSRDGFVMSVPDPETMNAVERESFVRLLKDRMGITDH